MALDTRMIVTQLPTHDASYHIAAEPGDSVDADNYLCCGKCGTHKEARRQYANGWTVFRAMCACEQAQYEAEENARKERETQLMLEHLTAIGLRDGRYSEATFANFRETPENAKVRRACESYVENFDAFYEDGRGLLLCGTPGTGKTFAAACIANALRARTVPVLMDSILHLTEGFDDDAERARSISGAKLLIIDDFGAERNTDFKCERVFDLIERRYAARKPMILTTNLSVAQMKGETDMRRRRVYDRILEVCYPIPMEWESFRRQGARASFARTGALLGIG